MRHLLEAIEAGIATIGCSGIAVPLTTLRPEICLTLFIREPGWFERQIEIADSGDHWFELNWEYGQAQSLDAMKLPIGADLQPPQSELIHPSRLVPHAAAALSLGLQMIRGLDPDVAG